MHLLKREVLFLFLHISIIPNYVTSAPLFFMRSSKHEAKGTLIRGRWTQKYPPKLNRPTKKETPNFNVSQFSIS